MNTDPLSNGKIILDLCGGTWKWIGKKDIEKGGEGGNEMNLKEKLKPVSKRRRFRMCKAFSAVVQFDGIKEIDSHRCPSVRLK